MTGFTRFGEAARVYAENVALVEEMRDRMLSEIDAFLAAVKAGLRHEVGRKVSEHRGGTKWPYRIWWCRREGVERGEHARVWFYDTMPGIVVPGRLRVNVEGPGDDGRRRRLRGVAADLELDADEGDEGAVFSFDLEIPDADPVGRTVGELAPLFLALCRVEDGFSVAD
jgi:hypothetical protein